MIFRNSFFLIVAFAVLCTSLLLSDTLYADNHNLTKTNDGENGKKTSMLKIQVLTLFKVQPNEVL